MFEKIKNALKKRNSIELRDEPVSTESDEFEKLWEAINEQKAEVERLKCKVAILNKKVTGMKTVLGAQNGQK